MPDLSGKWVPVTGAAGGIGRLISLAHLQPPPGLSV